MPAGRGPIRRGKKKNNNTTVDGKNKSKSSVRSRLAAPPSTLDVEVRDIRFSAERGYEIVRNLGPIRVISSCGIN